MAPSHKRKSTGIVRWMARISSGIAAAALLAIFIGEGVAEEFASLRHLSVSESLMMIALAAVWLGLMLGWKWELQGGSLALLATALFYLLNYLFSGSLPKGPFFLIFASPGVLLLYCAFRDGRRPEAGDAERDDAR